MHIVMISMQDSTKTMAVHLINTAPVVATQLLQVAAIYTAEQEQSAVALGRAH
jgi:hypothetical protein